MDVHEPLTCTKRLGVCCVGSSLSRIAYFFSFLFVIIGWCVLIADWSWTNHHEPPPYRFTFWHIVPGLLVTLAVFVILLFANASSADDDLLLIADEHARRSCILSMIEVFLCLLCTLVPLVFVLILTHRTWYDSSALPPRRISNVTSIEADEGLRRGLFSSIGGTKTTTPPPTTAPPPLTWPPFEGPDLVPAAYVLHIASICASLGSAIVAKLWQAQERRAAREEFAVT